MDLTAIETVAGQLWIWDGKMTEMDLELLQDQRSEKAGIHIKLWATLEPLLR